MKTLRKLSFEVKSILILTLILSLSSSIEAAPKTAILADLDMLSELQFPILKKSEKLNLAYSEVSESQQRVLEYKAHSFRKCGGYENLGTIEDFNLNSPNSTNATRAEDLFEAVDLQNSKNELYSSLPFRPLSIVANSTIQKALTELREENLITSVKWLASYPDRYNRSSEPNLHVFALQKQIEQMLKPSGLNYEINLIDHQATRQKSLSVRITGAQRPDEIIVLGGHLDSINQWGGGKAPGADDNASGSSNLMEALRVLSHYPQPSRSLEFFWYAGEESGLLGSAEIAKNYKKQNKNVIAVLQLDMTLFPGAGEFVIGNVEDYTSSWLRAYLVEINHSYNLGATFVSDKCGYACSDHASWYRYGYPTLLPFEADTQRMNASIHTARDILSNQVSFQHSLVFAKIALIFAMDLGNSTNRQPY